MTDQKSINKSGLGVTVLELLVSLALLSLVFTIGVNGFNSLFTRMQVKNGVRMVTAAFSAARYKSIQGNKRVKVSLVDSRIQLMEKVGRFWKPFHCYDLDPKVSFVMNASPVFSSYGSVAPLCSTYVENKYYRYKITISMAGRIKVVQLE